MARRTVMVPYRRLTPGRLNAVLFAQLMEKKASRGDRFAARFAVLARKRQWDAMAAVAALFSDGGVSPSTRDFRYAVPRDILLLSLKICCALLVLIATAAGALWISEPVDSRPQPARAVNEKKVRPALPRVPTDLDDLAGLLRALDPPEARPQRRQAPASDQKAEPRTRPALPIDAESSVPAHPEVPAGLEDLDGLLRALELERRSGHEALSDAVEIETILEELSDPDPP